MNSRALEVSESVFIDWLTIYQEFPTGVLPLVGSELVLYTDIESGEIKGKTVKGFEHAGSFDTRLHVKSDGTFLYVSGNPSAYGRRENLFGVRSVFEAVDIYNAVLDSLGLPNFDNVKPNELIKSGFTLTYKKLETPISKKGKLFNGIFLEHSGEQYAHSEKAIFYGKPKITRIDLTCNFSTNNPDGFLRHMSMFVYQGKAGYLYPNGKTVDWPLNVSTGNNRYSRRVYHKYYNKAHEIAFKMNKAFKAYKEDGLNLEKYKTFKYLEKLYNWCKDNGIVRREVSLKATHLQALNLQRLEAWSLETMAKIIYPYQFHHKLNVEQTVLSNVYDKLLELGYSKRTARTAGSIHTDWLNHDDIKKRYEKSSIYKYRKILLSLGVDILQPCDISKIALRVEKFTWKPIQAPDWYIMPTRQKAETLKAA